MHFLSVLDYYAPVSHLGELICAITATSGSLAGQIIFMATYLPFFYFGTDAHYPSLSAEAKFGLSLVSNLAMGIGCKTLVQFESTGVNFVFIISMNRQIYWAHAVLFSK